MIQNEYFKEYDVLRKLGEGRFGICMLRSPTGKIACRKESSYTERQKPQLQGSWPRPIIRTLSDTSASAGILCPMLTSSWNPAG